MHLVDALDPSARCEGHSLGLAISAGVLLALVPIPS
jgi:hypothetical protein